MEAESAYSGETIELEPALYTNGETVTVAISSAGSRRLVVMHYYLGC